MEPEIPELIRAGGSWVGVWPDGRRTPLTQLEHHLADENERLREKARYARAQAAAPDYDEAAIRDALWALVRAALGEDSDG